MIKNIKRTLVKKLTYQSNKRGCREMQIILGSFANQYLEKMDLENLQHFALLLQQNDCDIYNWLTKKAPIPANLHSYVMDKLLSSILINKQ